MPDEPTPEDHDVFLGTRRSPRPKLSMPDKPDAPTEPAANDVRIWEHCEVSWGSDGVGGVCEEGFCDEAVRHRGGRVQGGEDVRTVAQAGCLGNPDRGVHTAHRTGGKASTAHVIARSLRLASAPTPASKPSSSA